MPIPARFKGAFPRNLLRLSLSTCAGALLLSGCSKPPMLEKVQGFAEGTTYHISWWSKKPVPVADIKAGFNTTLAQIDKELSTYRKDSYISRFNQSHSTDWQPASKDFIELLEIAKDIEHKTQGCYDPTIGPLFDLWGFQNNVLHVPTQAQIDAVKGDLGMDKIKIDPAKMQIRKTVAQLQIDLSSMGEGYTIGKLSQVLEANGINNYLVEFGGDMKIKGHKPNGDKWRIAIEKPVMDKKNDSPEVYKIVTINDEKGVTLDTSGTYHHNFDVNGKEYSHILDPRTGAPVTHNLVSASVFGSDPRVSDAWATAMLCLGPQEGKAVAAKEHLPVFFITNDNGKFDNDQSEALATSKRVTFEKNE
ncbi:FAD:protein FMN transferase [Gallaecimonas mangrovi]|uniref:FAD:protein FMN transferase n=1 Tax=Gallaecimonas mangrovi TaxID=2291597 RepID=UPI000E205D87|nr:FAD:protein FMN transferase [Gallaecimonas mangrovi]